MKNAREMKAGNRLNVLRLLRRENFSRSELAEATGLTRAAMSLIVGELLVDGLVVEAGRRKSASGRRPVPVELNPEYAYSLGLTISRTGAEAGVANLCGRLLCRVPIDIAGLARQQALRRIKACLRDLMRKHASPSGRWLGLGISTPGPVDVASGTILNPPNFDIWHDICLANEMKDVGLDSVFLENNAQALTMAEKTFGAGRQSNSFVLLEVEAGVGGGIVCNGELYSGWRGFGNELGHTSIDMNGPLCSCGLRGCVEMYASVPKMLAKAQKLAKARKKVPRIHDWRSFMDRVAAGDSPCRDLLKEQARALGTAIVNVINVLELDAVVLTGDVLYRGEILRLDIERILNQTAINRWLRHIPVYLSPLGERPELMAAAGIPAEKFFQGQVEPAMVRQGNVKQKDLEDER
jgi:predicted NBD/HSP70 family sugar kinase